MDDLKSDRRTSCDRYHSGSDCDWSITGCHVIEHTVALNVIGRPRRCARGFRRTDLPLSEARIRTLRTIHQQSTGRGCVFPLCVCVCVCSVCNTCTHTHIMCTCVGSAQRPRFICIKWVCRSRDKLREGTELDLLYGRRDTNLILDLLCSPIRGGQSGAGCLQLNPGAVTALSPLARVLTSARAGDGGTSH